jgi:SAM-dependent methyltransferase
MDYANYSSYSTTRTECVFWIYADILCKFMSIMPLIWDEALYGLAYSQEQTHERELFQRNYWVDKLLEVLPGFSISKSMLIIGCGFGYTIEVLQNRGVGNVVGVDTSPYIQAEKYEKSYVPDEIYGSLDEIRGKYDWVITELVIESYNPATELPAFVSFLADIERPMKGNGHVAHIFAGFLGDGSAHKWSLGMTWLPLEDWVPYAPSHYWLDYHGWQIGGGI